MTFAAKIDHFVETHEVSVMIFPELLTSEMTI